MQLPNGHINTFEGTIYFADDGTYLEKMCELISELLYIYDKLFETTEFSVLN